MDVRRYVTPGHPLIKSIADQLETPFDAFKWVCDHLTYVREASECWLKPASTIMLGYGDCEDLANTLTSIIRAMGYPAESVVYRIEYKGRRLYHVVTKVGDIIFDPSIREINPGWLKYAKPILSYNESFILVHDTDGYRLLASPPKLSLIHI